MKTLRKLIDGAIIWLFWSNVFQSSRDHHREMAYEVGYEDGAKDNKCIVCPIKYMEDSLNEN